MKKQNSDHKADRPGADRSRNSSSSEKGSRSEDKHRGDGDRRPRVNRDSSFKSFPGPGQKSDFRERRDGTFVKIDRDSPRASGGDKKSFAGDRRPNGDFRPAKPFDRERASGGFKKSGDGKAAWGNKPFDGDRKRGKEPLEKRFNKPTLYGKPDFSENKREKDNFKKPFKSEFSDKPAYSKPDFERRPSESDYKRPERGERPGFERRPSEGDYKRPERGEKPGFERRPSGGDYKRPERGEKPGFERRPSGGDYARPERRDRPDFKTPRNREIEDKPSEGATRRAGKFEKAPDYRLVKKEKPHAKDKQENDDLIRLNRYISNAGICSRREADELIVGGLISVNGNVIVEMGFQVKPGDVVKYGKRVLNPEKMVYILLNKPKDYLTTTSDPEERKTVMDLIDGACKERVYPVGRLDRNTTGLLLLTNDGETAGKLTHPSGNVKKLYQAELDKPITTEDFEALQTGVTLEDGFIKPDNLAIVTPDAYVVGVEIHSGRNRIVRRMFEHLGYEVKKLDRTVFAGLDKKDLPRGKWRFLSEKEAIRLKFLI